MVGSDLAGNLREFVNADLLAVGEGPGEIADLVTHANGEGGLGEAGADGGRRVTVRMWNGSDYDIVIDDRVGAAS